jgi:hypothetical protein
MGDSAILAIWETQCQHGEESKEKDLATEETRPLFDTGLRVYQKAHTPARKGTRHSS